MTITTQNCTRPYLVKEVSKPDNKGVYFIFTEAEENKYETEFMMNEKDTVLQENEYRQRRSGMPETYMTKTGKDFDWSLYGENTKLISLSRKILNSFVCSFRRQGITGYGLYIYSATKGSGKTLLSCCIANEILKRHDVSVKFISISDYLEKCIDKSEAAREKIKAIKESSLLIVDDIGATTENKEWIMSAIFRLVDCRYKAKLPTIYTSNLKIDELKCGERAKERIYEDTIVLQLPEVNIRRMKADRYKREELKNMLKRTQEVEEESIF